MKRFPDGLRKAIGTAFQEPDIAVTRTGARVDPEPVPRISDLESMTSESYVYTDHEVICVTLAFRSRRSAVIVFVDSADFDRFLTPGLDDTLTTLRWAMNKVFTWATESLFHRSPTTLPPTMRVG